MYWAANAEWLNANSAKYYQENKDRLRQKKNAYKRAYRAKPGINRALVAARRASLKASVPIWSDNKKILAVYAAATRLGMQVDHIVPLTSELVCGLHVWDNLQLLMADENVRKGNRYWPDCP